MRVDAEAIKKKYKPEDGFEVSENGRVITKYGKLYELRDWRMRIVYSKENKT